MSNIDISKLRHAVIDNTLMIETLMENIISKYLSDSKEKIEELRVNIVLDLTFDKKRQIIEKLQLFRYEYFEISKKEYRKGIENIKLLQETRNNLLHCFTYNHHLTQNVMVNKIRRGIPMQIEINEKYVKKIMDSTKDAMSFLGGLLLVIEAKAGRIKDFSENFKPVN